MASIAAELGSRLREKDALGRVSVECKLAQAEYSTSHAGDAPPDGG